MIKNKIYAFFGAVTVIALLAIAPNNCVQEVIAKPLPAVEQSVSEQIQNLIKNISMLNAEQIEGDIGKILEASPDTVTFAGYTIVIPKITILNQQVAGQVTAVLNKISSEQMAAAKQYALALLTLPMVLLGQIKYVWNIALPSSINTLLNDAAMVANKLLLSSDAVDKTGIAVMQTFAQQVIKAVEKLYAKKANLTGYNVADDINNLKNTLKTNFNAISALVKRNRADFQKLQNDVEMISLADIEQVVNAVKAKIV